MTYKFEVNSYDNENVITVEVAYGSYVNSVKRTLKFNSEKDYDEPSLNELISDMVDNIRLTVKEREEVIHNANILKWYLQQYGVNKDRDPKKEAQMIVENGDPAVLSLSLS